MKTLTLHQPGHFEFADVPFDPTLANGHALVRVVCIGICGTDLHAYRGNQPFFTYPRVLGHELAVEVLALQGDPYGLKVGDFCAVEPYLDCGECQACRRGLTNCCEKLRVLGVHTDGGMVEYLKIPTGKLHPSNRLKKEQLALVETLAIGGHAVERAELKPDDLVLVVGAGPIGLSVVEFVKRSGATLVVADRDENRLRFCREKMGVGHTLLAADDSTQALRDMLQGDLPTVVFDATGNPNSMMKCFDYCAHGGKLVFVGLFQGDVSFHDPTFHRKELTLLASRNATSHTFRTIINAIENGRMDTTPWITHRVVFDALPDCFPTLLKPESGVIKAIVEMPVLSGSVAE
ncbi:zinc-binding alcohol dehydrogenase family protein [Salmonirosea aquatica]|uniref:Alcohol dehydrogenase catalytic domain-containing protein n=1 Tax=Salmonirosea aquatica TaxID=2654236 RepID=A0A7C9BC49_9BACT|nr:alcohol dehydrogenase catalytic domain-containing protein [Cytophagaceae bacterium SJW1-29]